MAAATTDEGDGDPQYHLRSEEVREYTKRLRQHPQPKHPVDRLLEEDILTSRHHWAACVLIRMRQCALLRVDLQRRGEVISDILGNTDAVVLDEDYIYILQHRLPKDQATTIEKICWGNYRESDYAYAHRYRESIESAFDALVKVLELLYDCAKSRTAERP